MSGSNKNMNRIIKRKILILIKGFYEDTISLELFI